MEMASDDLLAKDVFRHCRDASTLLSMPISTNKKIGRRFLKFFKGRVSSFCNKNAAKITEAKLKFVVIVTRISPVCVYDLGDDGAAGQSLKVCGKSCIREEKPYGAPTLLPKGAYLFSPAHGSLAYNDCEDFCHRQTCAVWLNELLVGIHDINVTVCDHAFHSKCLIPWFNKTGTCPVCRRALKVYVTRKVPLPTVSKA